MSKFLRDSAERHLKNILSLMQKGKTNNILKELERGEGTVKLLLKNPENEFFKENLQRKFLIFFTMSKLSYEMGRFSQSFCLCELSLLISQKLLNTNPEDVEYQSYLGKALTGFGILLSDKGCIEDAKDKYEQALDINEKLFNKNPENIDYQLDVAKTLNNLCVLFSSMGRIEDAKDTYEKVLDIYEKLLQSNPKNVTYQSDVATTFNNLGTLFSSMGRIEDAKDNYEKALDIYEELLQSDPKNVTYQSDVAMTLNNLGTLLSGMSLIEDAKNRYEKALDIYEKLLHTDPDNVAYQSNVAMTLNNLGNFLSNMGRIEDAKNRYEKALDMRQKLLQNDPENITYQSYVGTTLNNLGNLLSDMGYIEEAKQKYERALETFTEPMQYLTIGRKSNSIIRLIELSAEQAEKEDDRFNKMKHLRETFELCKKHQDFFIKYELKNERKLILEAGLSTYIEFLKISDRLESDLRKRAEKYEKALQTVEKIDVIDEDEAVSKLYSSAACYLRGRKLVNEALASRKPELELLSQAVEQFRIAKETYDGANVCFCVHTGLLNIIDKVENLEQIDVRKLRELVNEVVESLSEDVSTSIRVSLESIPQIFEERDMVTRKDLLKELGQTIDEIEYKALEKLFGHVHEKIKDYFEKPFNLNIIYDKWKLKVIFHDLEKIKGTLTIKAGDRILFERALSKEEIERNWLEIDYLDIGYLPQGEDVISFTAVGQKKPVFETVNYFEKIIKGHEIRILQHDCSNQVRIGKEPKIAAVQMKYHAYKEDSVVKISIDDNYHKKVMAILETLKNEADIIVFPEFSIPFDYLREIQKFTNENKILVIAGSHYVTENNLGSYGSLFLREFTEDDLMKNISPIIIPNSKIIHNEKYLGASIERPSFFDEGMEIGKVNHILKLREGLSIGIMICYEFLNVEYRHRLVPVCDVILVPQTNPDTDSFYDHAWGDIDRPLCGGTKHFIIANGIFTFGNGKKVQGGSTGTASTLNKHLNERREEGIVSPINGIMEQFVLISKINTNYFPAQDPQNAQEAVTDRLIQIFEESELLKNSVENKGSKQNNEDFIKLLTSIETCESRTELKHVLEGAQKEIYETELNEKVIKKSLIEIYSPLMNKRIQDLENLSMERMRKRCQFLLIPKS